MLIFNISSAIDVPRVSTEPQLFYLRIKIDCIFNLDYCQYFANFAMRNKGRARTLFNQSLSAFIFYITDVNTKYKFVVSQRKQIDFVFGLLRTPPISECNFRGEKKKANVYNYKSLRPFENRFGNVRMYRRPLLRRKAIIARVKAWNFKDPFNAVLMQTILRVVTIKRGTYSKSIL